MTRDGRASTKDWTLPAVAASIQDTEPPSDMHSQARKSLHDVLGLSVRTDHENTSEWSSSPVSSSAIPTCILPDQISYAGSHPAQEAQYDGSGHAIGDPSSDCWKMTLLHPMVRDSLLQNRRLYRHQAEAIQSALRDQHTLVCTGTGSGKSLCYLVPVLQRAVAEGKKSLLLFPTKALAQDQLVKLQGILSRHSELAQHVRAATLDGDTPHSQRSLICSTCNVVLTNPDTLHASILPNWKNQYKELLQELKYVVIDEAHMYEGVFGAHVAMILARLYRVHCCCRCFSTTIGDHGGGSDARACNLQRSATQRPGHDDDQFHSVEQTPSLPSSSMVFLACSATLAHPEHHFRLLCCIPASLPVTVLTSDASPRAAKHFWVWNPPLLDENGKSLGYVRRPLQKSDVTGSKTKATKLKTTKRCDAAESGSYGSNHSSDGKAQRFNPLLVASNDDKLNVGRRKDIRRRHAADETALLLARAVSQGVRCIAFCKTRCLVEWVFERCISALKDSSETKMLVSKVESYRGGYSKRNRREIEDKLFHNRLLGVVGTSALELGVDIGGVDLTLHCGFPSSHASLMQQAGRAGRGAAAQHRPSLAICVCFNSPVDQHLWRHPESLLSRRLSKPLSMPIYPGLVQGHLLCASKEWPLMGKMNASSLQNAELHSAEDLLSDEGLFGSNEVYKEALENLVSQCSVSMEKVPTGRSCVATIFKCHPSIKHPSTMVSIRSIESVNYDIIDLEHPLQNRRMDGAQDEATVLGKSKLA
jgi:DEAD/DEAH box helicase domain-containing protein